MAGTGRAPEGGGALARAGGRRRWGARRREVAHPCGLEGGGARPAGWCTGSEGAGAGGARWSRGAGGLTGASG